MLASVRISHKKVKLLHQKSDILILIITATPNSGFWFYNTCASTSTCWSASVVSGSTVPAQCRLLCLLVQWSASVVSGSTVLVQAPLLADMLQWFLALQYLCRHFRLLISISGFCFYNTCAGTSTCWSASVVSGSTVLAQVHLLQYLCRHFCLLISISGFCFYNTCAGTSTCWSASVVSGSTVLAQVHLLQYLCRHFYMYADEHQWFLVLQYLCRHLYLLICISGFWFCSTCASASACSSASMVFGSTVLTQAPLLADIVISFSGFWFSSTCADTFACWWALVVSGSAVLAQAPLLAG